MSIRNFAIVALSIYGFSAHAETLSLTQHPWNVMTERQGPFSFKKECLIQAARDASLAYSSHHASSETEKVLPLDESEYNPGYVLVRRQGSVVDIVLTFKGTSNLWDGLTDITLPMVHCAEIEGDGDRVHRGFHSRSKKVLPLVEGRLQQVISELSPADKAQVHVVGHSLGGAVATLTALMLEKNKTLLPHGITSVTTFGAPPTGNSTFVSAYNEILGSRTAHIIQTLDPVPLLGHKSYVSWNAHTKLFSQESNPHGISNYTKSLELSQPSWYQTILEKIGRNTLKLVLWKANDYLPSFVHRLVEAGDGSEELVVSLVSEAALLYFFGEEKGTASLGGGHQENLHLKGEDSEYFSEKDIDESLLIQEPALMAV